MTTVDHAVVWHDAECGAYAADLPLWRAMATDGPILDVGAGTGRVALDLAAHGALVTALDREPAFLEALAQRAHERGVSVSTEVADAATFDLGARRFAVVLAAMQLVQLLDHSGRLTFLRRAAAHLAPGGVVVCAVADALEGGDDAERTEPPLPDILEVEGTVFASQPVAVRVEDEAFVIERLRHTIGPQGEMTVEPDSVRLYRLSPEALIAEAAEAGLREAGRHRIEATDLYVGSVVVVLRP